MLRNTRRDGNNARMTSATTRKLWLFGHPIAHSLSAVMYNAAFAHLGLDWRYEALDVPPSELASAFARARAERILGGNLTIPHKVAALALMDKVDSTAITTGAVNTFLAAGVTPLPARASAFPRLTGFNTDGFGLAEALREEFQLELRGKRVAILGAGGAAQAAAVQCALDGAAGIFILNRTTERASALAEKIRAAFPSVNITAGFLGAESSGGRSPELDLIINATSLGLHLNDPQPIACENIAGVPFVYDMIYRPAETKFLRCAREAGARTANGLSMLLHQGVRALELWLAAHAAEKNLHAPVEVMRDALHNAMK